MTGNNNELNEINFALFKNDFEKGYLSKTALNNLLKNENNNSTTQRLNKKTQKKKISIIIPTHNRVKQLAECIDSIFKQSYGNFEIIVVDDCSTDDTKKSFEKYNDTRLKYYFNEKNLGMGLNRQKAFNLAKGDYVLFIDDDDYFIDDNYFNDVIEIFEDKNIDVIFSNSYIYYEKEKCYDPFKLNIYGVEDCMKYLNGFQIKYLKPTSSFPAIFRKELLDKADFKNMTMMNDSSIYLRALAYGNKAYFNKKIIGIYRMHTNNISYNVKADFTIENLEEKKRIYEIIRKKLNNPQKWLFNEIKITVCYFLNGKENDKKEINKVLNWTKINVGFIPYLYYKAYKPLRKIKIKMKGLQ